MAKGKERTEEEALFYISPIIPLLETGMSMLQACDYAQIDRPTVIRYRDKFETIATTIKKARMHAIATASSTVLKASGKDARIALEVLKRRDRNRWGDNVDMTTDGQAINLIDFTNARTNTETDRSSSSD